MKIKYYRLYEINTYLILILTLGYLNFIPGSSDKCMLIAIILSIFSFFIYVTQERKKKIYMHGILFYLLGVILIFFIQIIRYPYLNNFIYPNIKLAMISYDGIFLLLMCFPIYEVLSTNAVSNFLKNIAVLGYVELLIRLIIWSLYNFSNFKITAGFRIGNTWSREIFGMSLMRLPGTFLDPFLIICFFNQAIDKLKEHNSKYIFYIVNSVVVLLYTAIVSQFRVNFIAMLLICVLIFYLKIDDMKRKTSKKMFLTLILFVLILLNLQNIIEYLYSFSVNNTVNGASTSTRLNGLPAYIYEWKSTSLLMGMGFVTPSLEYFKDIFWISDYGIWGELFRFGIIGFIIYLYPFFKGINLLFKHFKTSKKVFVIGLTMFYLITSISIDPMENTNIMLLSLYLAFLLNSTRLINEKN